MKECQCEDIEEIMYQGAYYCSKCYTVIDDLIYEELLTKEDKTHKTRKTKFDNLLLSTVGLPWFVRQTLMDSFHRIENHFYDSERINFINMNQLAIELCKLCGYEQYCYLFKPLKTKNRVKQVSAFVREAIQPIALDTAPVGTFRLEDMPLIECTAGFIDFSRIPDDNHIYSDIDETRKAVKVTKVTKGRGAKNKTNQSANV